MGPGRGFKEISCLLNLFDFFVIFCLVENEGGHVSAPKVQPRERIHRLNGTWVFEMSFARIPLIFGPRHTRPILRPAKQGIRSIGFAKVSGLVELATQKQRILMAVLPCLQHYATRGRGYGRVNYYMVCQSSLLIEARLQGKIDTVYTFFIPLRFFPPRYCAFHSCNLLLS
jgi:hypothetical protein